MRGQAQPAHQACATASTARACPCRPCGAKSSRADDRRVRRALVSASSCHSCPLGGLRTTRRRTVAAVAPPECLLRRGTAILGSGWLGQKPATCAPSTLHRAAVVLQARERCSACARGVKRCLEGSKERASAQRVSWPETCSHDGHPPKALAAAAAYADSSPPASPPALCSWWHGSGWRSAARGSSPWHGPLHLRRPLPHPPRSCAEMHGAQRCTQRSV
jgi:hypothetical protein